MKYMVVIEGEFQGMFKKFDSEESAVQWADNMEGKYPTAYVHIEQVSQ